MNEKATRSKSALLDAISGQILGQLAIDLCDEDHQIIIQGIELEDPEYPVASISVALQASINGLIGQIYHSAIAWPSSSDNRTCAILEGAGFIRTGLFMRRSAFKENEHIEFKPLSYPGLDKYLDTQAQKVAMKAASFYGHEVEKVFNHVRQEYREQFSNGPCSDNESILCILDVVKQEEVGILWISFRQEGTDHAVFIEEFEIWKSHRGKGYGESAMRALGNTSFSRSIDMLSLFVQPENSPAFNLYRKLGFQPGRFEYMYSKTSSKL